MKFTLAILSAIFLLSSQLNLCAQNLSHYVNPFIGTGGHGHTFPGPTLPFGACQVGPDTRLSGWDGCSGYHYSDSLIYGFSHTHLSGTGCSDYGDILLMPTSKEVTMKQYDYASKFSHLNESAGAGRYHVKLDTWKIDVNLTCTKRVGIHEYKFQEGQDQFIVLDLKHRDEVLDSKLEIVNDSTVRGYRYSKAWAKNQKVYYYIQFSRPFTEKRYNSNDVESKSITSPINLEKQLHVLFMFEKNINPLMVKVGISGVDEDGAKKNLESEAPHWNFSLYQKNAEKEWDQELSKIKVGGTSNGSHSESRENQYLANSLTIFYTALYHTMIHPSIYNDVDGRYRGRDEKIHNTEGKFDYYSVFSLWDTYRSLHPLLTILDKKRTNDFINTFIKQYEQIERLPIWELSSNETNCMIGYHVVSVIWDAFNKGIRNYDIQSAYKAMTSIATHYNDYDTSNLNFLLKKEARSRSADADALESYCKYGYVRSDDAHESVSKTLEFAYDDWCIAQMANALGKKKDYEYYLNRSHNWINVYDPTTGFMRARKNGTLYEPFSPYTVDNNFTEANSWQYSFYVPHDINHFESLYSKKSNFTLQLDALFSAKQKTEGREQADITGLIGQYAHGNEPSHQIAYLYNYSDEPGKTAMKTNYILNNFYINEPDGLIGNEDCGQMSAWYVLTALGIYPLCPGNNTYEITEPLFDHVTILSTINLHKEKNVNKPLSYSFTINQKRNITHADLLNSKPKFFKSTKPISNNFISSMPLPNSVPFIKNGMRIFKDSFQIEMQCVNNHLGAKTIYYKLNHNTHELKYISPFYITENTDIEFYTKNKFNKANQKQTSTFTKLPSDRQVILKSNFNKSYTAGGADAMIDGIFGKLNWRAGDWQGFQGQNVEAIIVFNKSKKIKSISANFLEDQNSWIFYPKEVSFYTSNDSISWTLIETIPTNKTDHSEKISIDKLTTTTTDIPWCKFIKMIAANFGQMPQWHEGRGNETFVFIDEIEIN